MCTVNPSGPQQLSAEMRAHHTNVDTGEEESFAGMTGPNRLSKVERPSTVQWCAIRRFLIRLHLSSGTSQARCYAHVQAVWPYLRCSLLQGLAVAKQSYFGSYSCIALIDPLHTALQQRLIVSCSRPTMLQNTAGRSSSSQLTCTFANSARWRGACVSHTEHPHSTEKLQHSTIES